MRVISTIVWDGHNQWSYVIPTEDSTVLQLWQHVGAAEPKKLYAWNLTQNTAYQDFLNFLLQKFHMSTKQLLKDTVTTIILVQNQFTLAQMKENA